VIIHKSKQEKVKFDDNYMSLLFECDDIKNKTLKVIWNMIVDEESAKDMFDLVLSVFNESKDETT